MTKPERLGKTVIILLFVAPLALYFLTKGLTRPVFHEIPKAYSMLGGDTVYHRLPAFSLPLLGGDSLHRADLEGNISFLHLFSLRDSQKAPIYRFHLQRMYDNLDLERYSKVRLVSVCTEAQPEALAAWAAERKVDAAYWPVAYAGLDQSALLARSLFGPEQLSRDSLAGGFSLDMAVLLDKSGQARKYYTLSDLGAVRKMEEDFRAILLLDYPEDLGRELPLKTAPKAE
jgi:hypothetical protein